MGRGRSRAPLRALQGPRGYGRGPGFDSRNNFTRKIPILTRKGRILTRDRHCLAMGCSCAGWAGPKRSRAPLRALQGPQGCARGPGFDSPTILPENPDIDAQRACIDTRSAFLTAGCICAGWAGQGRSTASLRALQDPQGCAWGPGFDSCTYFTELAVFA